MLDTPAQGAIEALTELAQLVRAGGYRFVTPTPATHARVNARAGNEWAGDIRGVFGWSRPFYPDVLPPAVFAAAQAAGILERHGDGWRSRMRLSTLDGLLFVHSAYPTTAAHSVFFGPDTYRFAQAITQALEGMGAVRRAVDIGCGAGPGAILVARARPEAEVIAVDINAEALRLTRINAFVAGVSVGALQSNLLRSVSGSFDLIVANPPYMADPARRAYRDGGGPLGAGLSLDILATAIERLAPGGTLLLYTGAAVVNGADPFRAAAAAQLSAAGLAWRYRELDPDVFGGGVGQPRLCRSRPHRRGPADGPQVALRTQLRCLMAAFSL